MNSPKTPSNSSPKIIKNQSKGYNYTYNNLADLAKAGVEIPPMKTAIVEGREYVFAKIGDEWIQGARVIGIEMNNMNAAQAYGSALTYARRYTVQLVMGIACDDDDKLEAHTADDRKNANSKPAKKQSTKTYPKNNIDFQEIRDNCKIIDDLDSLQDYYKGLHVEKMSPAQQNAINGIINNRKKELEH